MTLPPSYREVGALPPDAAAWVARKAGRGFYFDDDSGEFIVREAATGVHGGITISSGPLDRRFPCLSAAIASVT